jgi:NADPH-dependent glutamate synthase beta subunit-like oxidoreductase
MRMFVRAAGSASRSARWRCRLTSTRASDKRKAIYRHFPQAIPSAYAVDKLGVSPCKDACPAGVSAQGYVALIAQGKYAEALKLIRQNNPLPAICGRVCTHPCEEACARGELTSPWPSGS